MAEAKRPEGIVFRSLSQEMKERYFRAVFVRYRKMVEAILRKDGEASRARGGDRAACGDPAQGKARVEEYPTKPPVGTGRLGPPPPQRSTGPPRGARGRRGGNGGSRRLPPRVAEGGTAAKF
ncbi:hypothetical protein NN561_019683 [Cricetulus griseus]